MIKIIYESLIIYLILKKSSLSDGFQKQIANFIKNKKNWMKSSFSKPIKILNLILLNLISLEKDTKLT